MGRRWERWGGGEEGKWPTIMKSKGCQCDPLYYQHQWSGEERETGTNRANDWDQTHYSPSEVKMPPSVVHHHPIYVSRTHRGHGKHNGVDVDHLGGH